MAKSFLGLGISDLWNWDLEETFDFSDNKKNARELVEKLQTENVHLFNKALKHYLQTNGVK